MERAESIRHGMENIEQNKRIAGDLDELDVWQRSKDFTVFLYRVTDKGGFRKDTGLRDQIRSTAVCLTSGIAEADNLGSSGQAIELFYGSKAAAAKLMTQTSIAYEIGYLTEYCFDQIREECQGISNMLARLIHARIRAAH